MDIRAKFTLLYFLCFIFSAPATAQMFAITEDPRYLSRDLAYRYKINKEEVTTFVPGAGLQMDSFITKESYYDSLGRIQEIRHFRRGVQDQRIVYLYKGNLLDSAYNQLFSAGFTIFHKVSYDKNGKPVEERRTASNSREWVIFRYFYNDSGRLEAIHRSINGKKLELYDDYYYSGNRLIKRKEYTAGWTKEDLISYEYNDSLRTVVKYYHEGIRKVKVSENKYNEKGLLTRRITYKIPLPTTYANPDPDYATEIFEYNENNTLASRTWVRDGKPTRRLLYRYF